MIKGHGIDIESITAIEKAYQKNARFVEKVLTEAERARFEELSGKRKMEYLTGRWSAKEAFSKAMASKSTLATVGLCLLAFIFFLQNDTGRD